MLTPTFGSFHQFAWVTSDMERSLAVFRDVYGIPSFLVTDQAFDAVVGGEAGKMQIRIAFANVDGTEFEVIQPVGDGLNTFYRDALPADGRYATVFHHFCVKVHGSREDWERHLGGLHPDRTIYYQRPDKGSGLQFVYTDDRPFLGHYVEHVWCTPEMEQAMASAIPHFHTRGT